MAVKELTLQKFLSKELTKFNNHYDASKLEFGFPLSPFSKLNKIQTQYIFSVTSL